jgi:hypothetical protein
MRRSGSGSDLEVAGLHLLDVLQGIQISPTRKMFRQRLARRSRKRAGAGAELIRLRNIGYM